MPIDSQKCKYLSLPPGFASKSSPSVGLRKKNTPPPLTHLPAKDVPLISLPLLLVKVNSLTASAIST